MGKNVNEQSFLAEPDRAKEPSNPSTSELQAQISNAQSLNLEIQPKNSNFQLLYSNIQAHRRNIRSLYSNLQTLHSDLRVLNSNIQRSIADCKTTHILLVGNNADMHDYVQQLLSERWYIETAANSETALTRIKSYPLLWC